MKLFIVSSFLIQSQNVVSVITSDRQIRYETDFESQLTEVVDPIQNQTLVSNFEKYFDFNDVSGENLKILHVFHKSINSQSWEILSEKYKETPAFIVLEEEKNQIVHHLIEEFKSFDQEAAEINLQKSIVNSAE